MLLVVNLFQRCGKARGVVQSVNALAGPWKLLCTSDSEFSESTIPQCQRIDTAIDDTTTTD